VIKKFVSVAAAAIFGLAAAPAHAGLVYMGTYAGNDNVSGNNNGINNDIHDEIFAYNGDTTVEFLAKINICEDDVEQMLICANPQVPENGAVSASSFDLINNGTSGSVEFDLTGTGYGLEYVALKGATSFALYYWDMDPSVGVFLWDLVGVLINNGGQTPDLSHISFYGGDYTPPNEVPLPAAAWLMIAGLGGLGFAGRRMAA